MKRLLEKRTFDPVGLTAAERRFLDLSSEVEPKPRPVRVEKVTKRGKGKPPPWDQKEFTPMAEKP
jgi:hypothetical protein